MNFKLIVAPILILALCFAFGGAAATEDEFFEPKTTLGGYGELHLNYKNPESGPDAPPMLDFHRFILFASHSWTPKLSFKSELELEHNFVKGGKVDAGGQGELELEQAYIDYILADWVRLQTGVILVSAGLYNEYHEPPLFLSVERPGYSKSIIPTTWFGNGIALAGEHRGRVEYRLALMEGLNTAKVSAGGIRSARVKGFKAVLNNVLLNAKVDYTGMAGLRVGASYSRNHLMENDADNFQPYQGINLMEAHARVEKSGVHATAEGAYTLFEAENLAPELPEASFGYYLEVGYNIAHALKKQFKLVPWTRWQQFNTAAKAGSSAVEEANALSEWRFGLAFLPISQVVFKADMALQWKGADNDKTTLVDLGAGYNF